MRAKYRGFTLVELLIAVAIIGLLIQLILPGVESSREAARKTQCANNLRQIGIGVLAHEAAIGHFPAGGWGYLSVGDPDRGVGREQPGGWIYNSLPFLEQKELHDLGKDQTGDEKKEATRAMLSTALGLFNCPSRRLPRPYPFDHEVRDYCNYDPPDTVGKSDYAGNGGDAFYPDSVGNGGPPSYEAADKNNADTAGYWRDTSAMNGIFFQRSMTRSAEIRDGLSNTYLCGEKYAEPSQYRKRIVTSGDDQCMYVGADFDIVRWARYQGRILIPQNDKDAFEHDEGFGSAHTEGCQMLLCDGSLKVVAYDVEDAVHLQLANRRDNLAN